MSEELERAIRAVERGKRELVAAVPVGRAPGTPLADALHAFESALAEALGALAGSGSSGRDGLISAVEESAARAERLRLEAPPLDYETLVFTLSDLIAPLEAFEEAG